MSLPTEAVVALEAFQAVGSWEQRARLLMQWGERLPALPDEDKVDVNLVQGCESLVWLVGRLQDGHWQFAASSDARLIRGLWRCCWRGSTVCLPPNCKPSTCPAGLSNWACRGSYRRRAAMG